MREEHSGGKSGGRKSGGKAFAGTPLAMGKGARLLGAAIAGAFVLWNAQNMAQDAKHLSEGAEAEMAAEMRDEVKELAAELQELNKLQEELKGKLRGNRRPTGMALWPTWKRQQPGRSTRLCFRPSSD